MIVAAMPDYSDLNPANLKPGLTTPDGLELKPGLVTSAYAGGTPTASNQIKASLRNADGSLKPGLISGSALKASLLNAAGPAVPSMLLDNLSPAAVYSPARQLLTAYTGPLLRVRRASDNAEQDIGFDVDGLLDETAIAAFCGVAIGYITTWYDQTTGAHHLTNAEAAKQWRIWSGTATVKKNARPAAWSTSAASYMRVASGFTYTALSSCNVVQNSLTNAHVYQFGTLNQGGSMSFTTAIMRTQGNAAQGAATITHATNSFRQFAGIILPTGRRIFADGVEGTPAIDATVLSGADVGLVVGASTTASGGMAGYFGDQVFFTREFSDAHRIAVSDDQKAFYGTP